MSLVFRNAMGNTKSQSQTVYIVQYHNLEYYKFYEIGNVVGFRTIEAAHEHAMGFIEDHNREVEDETEKYKLARSITGPPTEEEFARDPSYNRCYYVYTPTCVLWIQKVTPI